jgi:hypothetical protein
MPSLYISMTRRDDESPSMSEQYLHRGPTAPWSPVADGNETIPTVVIDGHAVVNPPPRHVIAAIRDQRT